MRNFLLFFFDILFLHTLPEISWPSSLHEVFHSLSDRRLRCLFTNNHLGISRWRDEAKAPLYWTTLQPPKPDFETFRTCFSVFASHWFEDPAINLKKVFVETFDNLDHVGSVGFPNIPNMHSVRPAQWSYIVGCSNPAWQRPHEAKITFMESVAKICFQLGYESSNYFGE